MSNSKKYQRAVILVDKKKYDKARKILKEFDRGMSMSQWFRKKIQEVIDGKQ